MAEEDIEDQQQQQETTVTTTTILKASISAGFYPNSVNNNGNIIPKQLAFSPAASAVFHQQTAATRDELRSCFVAVNGQPNDPNLPLFCERLQTFYATLQRWSFNLKRSLVRFINSAAFHEVICLMVLLLLVLQLGAMLAMNIAYCKGWPLCIFEDDGYRQDWPKNACETTVFRYFLKNCNANRVGYLDGRAVPARTETLEMSLTYYLVLVFASLLLTMALPFFAATTTTITDNHHHHHHHHQSALFYFTAVLLYLATMSQLLVDIAFYLPLLVLFGEHALQALYSAIYIVTAVWQIMQAVYLLAISHRRNRKQQMLMRQQRQQQHFRRLQAIN